MSTGRATTLSMLAVILAAPLLFMLPMLFVLFVLFVAAFSLSSRGLRWRVVVRPVPINVSAIPNAVYRNRLPKSGSTTMTKIIADQLARDRTLQGWPVEERFWSDRVMRFGLRDEFAAELRKHLAKRSIRMLIASGHFHLDPDQPRKAFRASFERIQLCKSVTRMHHATFAARGMLSASCNA